MVFPWFRSTVGVGLVEGLGAFYIAGPSEVYASSSAACTVPIAARAIVTTCQGLRLIATPASARVLSVDRLIVPGAR